MTAGDIADELRQLSFERSRFNAIKIDEPVRDYLLTALARHVSRRD